MRVGITGAYGFVGSHLLDALTSMSVVEVEPFERNTHDLFRIESLKPFVEDKEVIFHLANLNRDTHGSLIITNVLGTLHLMEALSAYAKNDIRIVYLSSFQVYKVSPTQEPITEQHPTHPQNIYGVSKKAAEEIIACYPFRSIILRGSNFYGPRGKPYYNSVIATFCDLLAQNKPFTVHGSGEQARDFLYIRDVVEVLTRALHYEPGGVEIINLCSGKVVTINQLIEMLFEVSGRKVTVDYQSVPDDTGAIWRGDNTACREKFDWFPQVGIKEGLRLTYEWFMRRVR